MNLHESGVDVIVGLYQGSKSWAKAEDAGLTVVTAAEAAKEADIIMMLVNDEKQTKLYKESIEPNLAEGKALIFAPGFVEGKEVPCLIAIHQDASGKARETALAYALGIGCLIRELISLHKTTTGGLMPGLGRDACLGKHFFQFFNFSIFVGKLRIFVSKLRILCCQK